MSRSTMDWTWVLGQAMLLGVLILLPGRAAWPTPGLVEAVAAMLFFSGLAIIVMAALGLGTQRSRPPTPVPTQHATLSTNGFYRYVRHPI